MSLIKLSPLGRVRHALLTVVVATALIAVGCDDEPVSAPPTPDPPLGPGPHFSFSPIPVDSIARITVVGSNSKVWPTPHTYWLTCDFEFILRSDRPCVLARLPIVAPADGEIRGLDPSEDGHMAVEGPPGLVWTFGHVTPRPGLAPGDSVFAGDTIATMAVQHGFDFGLQNVEVEHPFVAPHRYNTGFLHAEHPIAQFPEPLRSAMTERVPGMADGLGRLSWDVTGTAAGNWALEDAPDDATVLDGDNGHMLMHMGRLADRIETRLFVVGERWPGMVNQHISVGPDEPSWESITPDTSPISLRLHNFTADGLPDIEQPAGLLRVQMLDDASIRVEWFDTEEPVEAFTSASRVYVR